MLTLLQVQLNRTTSANIADVNPEVNQSLEAVGLIRWHGKLAFDVGVEVPDDVATAATPQEERTQQMGTETDGTRLGGNTECHGGGILAVDVGVVRPPPMSEIPRLQKQLPRRSSGVRSGRRPTKSASFARPSQGANRVHADGLASPPSGPPRSNLGLLLLKGPVVGNSRAMVSSQTVVPCLPTPMKSNLDG